MGSFDSEPGLLHNWYESQSFLTHISSFAALTMTDPLYRTAYRLTSFPLIHLNFIHTILNVVALTPLLERFESEYGTLTSLALFFGRMILLLIALTAADANIL